MTRIVVYLVIGTAILAIDIREERWSVQIVIHSRIENLLLLGRCAIDANLRDLVVPLCVALLAHLVELRRSNLTLEVQTRTLQTYRRQCRLHSNLLALLGAEVDTVVEVTLIDRLERVERLRELDDEEYLLCICPAIGVAMTNNATVALGLGIQILGTIPATTVHKVEDDCRLVACREGVAMQTTALGSCKLGEDVIACQRHRVVAWLDNLLRTVRI